MSKIVEVTIRFLQTEAENEVGTEYAKAAFSSATGCKLGVTGDGLEPRDLSLVQNILKQVTTSQGFPNLTKKGLSGAVAAAKKAYPDDDDEDLDDDA